MIQPYRGVNRFRSFLKAGRTLANKVANLDGVVGVLGTGAIGRGFGDRFSDLDLLVYARREAVASVRQVVSIDWISHRGMDYDIPTLDFDKALAAPAPSKHWSQVVRWDHQCSRVLYDPEGKIGELLRQKLVYPEAEQRRLLARYKQGIHEHLVFSPELWAERGRLYHVIDTLVRGVQQIVLYIYARNKVFEPYIDKWLFFHLETQAVPEFVHLDRLTRVLARPPKDIKQAMRLRADLLDLCGQLGLIYRCYSHAEAREIGEDDWRRASEKTREVLSR
jgi:predicted nucleotidyltransferase